MAKKNDIPTGDRTRKPTPKKSFSLDDYMKNKGIEEIKEKPLRWLRLSPALQKATGLPGAPMGYTTLYRGFSNTGKSTALCETAVAAQKEGALPIFITTEGTNPKERLKLMGFDESLPHLFLDNDYLLERYGKVQDKKRGEASIEDMAECIKDILRDQEDGKVPFDIVFLIDSIGTLDCIRTINAMEKNTSDNNMWNAGAYEKSFKYLLNNTIPSSRKENKPYTNTFVAVQKIWIDSMGAGVVRHKGGEALFFASRLIFHFGGIAAHSTKMVCATSKGREVGYGTDTKVSVEKNHIDGPLGGISLKGEIMSMPHGFIFKEDLDEYKKEHILYFRNILGDESISAEEIGDKFITNKAADADAGIDYDQFIEKAD